MGTKMLRSILVQDLLAIEIEICAQLSLSDIEFTFQ